MPKIITAKFESTCPACSQRIKPGRAIAYEKGKPAVHAECVGHEAGNPVDQLLIEPAPDGDTWIECKECGAANWLSKLTKHGVDAGKLGHRSRCRSRQQYVPGACKPSAKSAAELDREIGESLRDEELRKFADNVRRTGMSKGRDEDVAESVRRGFLSVDDAMNTDD
jgi:hypothetical protein